MVGLVKILLGKAPVTYPLVYYLLWMYLGHNGGCQYCFHVKILSKFAILMDTTLCDGTNGTKRGRFSMGNSLKISMMQISGLFSSSCNCFFMVKNLMKEGLTMENLSKESLVALRKIVEYVYKAGGTSFTILSQVKR